MFVFITALALAAAPDPGSTLAVAVLMPTTQGDIDDAIPVGVMALAAGAMQEGGDLRVLTHDDIQQMVNYDQMKVALTCEESASCLAEIGSALGVPYLLATSCWRLGSAYVVSLSLVGIDPPQAIGRKTLTVSSDDELLTAVPAAVGALRGLIAPTTATATTAPEAPTATTTPTASTPDAAAPAAETPAVEEGSSVGGVVLTVVSGVLLAGSVAAVVLGAPVYLDRNAAKGDRDVAGIAAGAGALVGVITVVTGIGGGVWMVSE